MQSIRNLEYQQCRTCYDSTSNLQLLTSFAESSPIAADKTYAQLLLEVCNINIMNDKPLGRWPQFICLNCSRKLKLAHEFIQHSLKINQLLKSIADLLQIRCDSDVIEKPALDIPLEIKVEKDEDLDSPTHNRKFQYSPIDLDGPTVGTSLQARELHGHFTCINNASQEYTSNYKNATENVFAPSTIEFISDDIIIKDNLDKFHRNIINNMDNTEKDDSTDNTYGDYSLLTVAKAKSSKTTSEEVCNLCNKSFPNAWKLKEHKRFCKNFQTQCHICNQSFTRPYSYKRHFENIHKNKILKQQKPNKLPENRQTIKLQHLKSTNKINANKSKGNTACHLCKKKFLNHKRLIRHERYAHLSEEEKIQCSFCDRKFNRPDNYQTHLKRVHTTNDVSLSKTSTDIQCHKHSCSKCDRSFSRRTLLLKHEEDVHVK